MEVRLRAAAPYARKLLNVAASNLKRLAVRVLNYAPKRSDCQDLFFAVRVGLVSTSFQAYMITPRLYFLVVLAGSCRYE